MNARDVIDRVSTSSLRPAYKKCLQQHLKETRDHKRRVAARS